jgi:hypothetical protein
MDRARGPAAPERIHGWRAEPPSPPAQVSPAPLSIARLSSAVGNQAFGQLIGRREGDGILPDGVVHPTVERAVNASRGSGARLDPAIARKAAPTLGDPLTDVTVHTDSTAASLARAVAARAFTVGNDVYFAPGQYAPNSMDGDALLMHELAHVVQQRGAPAVGPLTVSQPGDASERDADAVAAGVAGPGSSRSQAMARQLVSREARPKISAGGALAVRRCACGGIVGAGGECTDCRRRRLAREGRSEDSELPLAQADCLDCKTVLPRVLARLEKDEAAQTALASRAVAVDGNALVSRLDSGARLDRGVRDEMEGLFGEDFSTVRIHTGAGANRLARTLNARAVTVGSHIILADGAFSPYSTASRQLLRHELAHVVQQNAASTIPNRPLRIASPTDWTERQADMFAANPSVATARSLSRLAEPQINRSFCGVMVEALAWGTTSALVAAVAAGCAIGSTVTFGGLVIPCTALVIGSAAVGAVDAVLWTNILKEVVCGEPQFTSAAPAGGGAEGAAPGAGEGQQVGAPAGDEAMAMA